MLIIDNKKYRNLQEQVGWNSEQIENIFNVIDGLNIQDNVIAVADISTPLTSEELEIVNRPVAFIVYSGSLFIKKSTTATTALFDIVFTISGTTVITFNSSEITVNLTNGAMGIATNSFSTYSKDQMDTLLTAKAGVSYVDGQLALKANLTGAAFTGNITAPSIIETMTGYSFTRGTPSNYTIDINYAGVVKNGNKLTVAIAFEITKLSGASSSINFGLFNLPADIMSKLYPNGLGNLDNKNTAYFSSSVASISVPTWVSKGTNYISIGGYHASLVENTKYYVRIESTFLLSDNLAS